MLEIRTTTPAENREFFFDPQAVKAVHSLIRSLHSMQHTITPLTIAAMAKQRATPGTPLPMAVAQFEAEIQQMLTEIADHAVRCEAARVAEFDRLAPLRNPAARRTFEIPGEIDRINRMIQNGEKDVTERRKKLSEAGLSAAEIDVHSPEFDPTDLIAERTALQAENAALEEFIQTGEESKLPAGFAASQANTEATNEGLEALAA